MGRDGGTIGLLEQHEVGPMRRDQAVQADPVGIASKEVPRDGAQPSRREWRGTAGPAGQADSGGAGISWTDQVFPSGSLKKMNLPHA